MNSNMTRAEIVAARLLEDIPWQGDAEDRPGSPEDPWRQTTVNVPWSKSDFSGKRQGSPPDVGTEEDPVRYKATFKAQAWSGDDAIEADPQGESTWDVTEFLQTMSPQKQALALEGPNEASDDLQQDPAAPEWVRQWTGPFYITVEPTVSSEDPEPGPPPEKSRWDVKFESKKTAAEVVFGPAANESLVVGDELSFEEAAGNMLVGRAPDGKEVYFRVEAYQPRTRGRSDFLIRFNGNYGGVFEAGELALYSQAVRRGFQMPKIAPPVNYSADELARRVWKPTHETP